MCADSRLTGGSNGWTRIREAIVERVSCETLLELSGRQQRGNRWPCPGAGHDEARQNDSPDLVCGTSENYFRCYSCGEQGSVFDLAVFLGLASDYNDALPALAQMAGVELPQRHVRKKRPEKVPESRAMEIRKRVAAACSRRFDDTVKVNGGADWLRRRGIPDEVATAARCGWVSDPKAMRLSLEAKFSTDELKAAGLHSRQKNWPTYQRNRLLIPCDLEGRGLVARRLSGGDYKEMTIKQWVFGVHLLPPAPDFILIAEGPIDWLSALAVGVPAIGVPGCGTWSLIIKALDSIPPAPLVILFDGDEVNEKGVMPGPAASLALRDALVSFGRTVAVLSPPRGLDLNDMLTGGMLKNDALRRAVDAEISHV